MAISLARMAKRPKAKRRPMKRRKIAPPLPATEPAPHDGLILVGVGASAGGLEAFTQLLESLDPDAGLALVLVQHLSPHHDSALVELLASHTAMQVMEVTARRSHQAESHLRDSAERADGARRRFASAVASARQSHAAHADRRLLCLAGGRDARPGHCRGVVGHRVGRRDRDSRGEGGRRHHLRANARRRRSSTACRARPSRRAWSTW